MTKMLLKARAAALAVLMSACCVASALGQSTNAQLLALIAGNVPSGNPSVLTASSLRAVLTAMVNSTNVAGTSCPTSSLTALQPWGNTTSSPAGVSLNVFDGANCVPWALLNETAHQLTIAGASSPAPGRNIIGRFGSMDVNQRQSTVTSVPASTTAYVNDGCYLATGANEQGGISYNIGLTAGSYKSVAVVRANGQTGTSQMTYGCPLDSDELSLALSNYVTLSFWVVAEVNFSAISGALTANVLCGTGTPVKQVVGYTNQVTVASLSMSLTPGGTVSRQQITSAAVVPSNCSQMEVQWVWSPTGTAGAHDAFDLDDVQLEVVSGPQAVATKYDAKDFQTQLRLSQRHYFKTFTYGTAPAQAAGLNTGEIYGVASSAGVSSANRIIIRFPTSMRVTPTVTTFNPQNSNANPYDSTATSDVTFNGSPSLNTDTWETAFTGVSGTAVADLVRLHLTADSGI